MKKLDIEFVEFEFAKEKFVLLTKKYKNSKQKLNFICPKGHKYRITWNSWQQGHRCAICSSCGRKRQTAEIREKFAIAGYKLLTSKYINSKQKLDYICNKGHRNKITWSDWNSGYRCAECAGLKKYSLKEIRITLEKENYKLLSSKYAGANGKLKYQCPSGHIGKTSWHSWKKGHRCWICYHKSRIKKLSDVLGLHDYRQIVTRLTNLNFSKYYYSINPLNLKRGKNYHLDHIYSVYEGFIHKISPVIISNPFNLRVIPFKENIVKRCNSAISLEELMERYNVFNRNREKGFSLS